MYTTSPEGTRTPPCFFMWSIRMETSNNPSHDQVGVHAELEGGKQDPRFPGSDRRYAHMDPSQLPLTESLKTTVDRFMPLWTETIAPAVKSGKHVIIAAHGNSLRVSISLNDHFCAYLCALRRQVSTLCCVQLSCVRCLFICKLFRASCKSSIGYCHRPSEQTSHRRSEAG